MNKPEALALVASYMAGLMQASDLEEVTGLTQTQQADMSDSDIDRLEWAQGVVIDRLYRMGSRKADDDKDADCMTLAQLADEMYDCRGDRCEVPA